MPPSWRRSSSAGSWGFFCRSDGVGNGARGMAGSPASERPARTAPRARGAAIRAVRRATRGHRASSRERERERELGTFALLALDVDPPAVRVDDALRDREPEAGAALLGAAVPVAIEDVRQLGG